MFANDTGGAWTQAAVQGRAREPLSFSLMIYRRRIGFGALALALVVAVMLVLWLMSQPRLLLLPQGINGVPSCEEPADVVAFSLTPCPEPSPTASTISGSGMPTLGVSNGTNLVVTLVVNGRAVADVRPGELAALIDTAAQPALPWTVEAQSPSGRVLTSMQVAQDQVGSTTNSDGTGSSQGAFGRVDLSCGRLTIWAGDTQPSGPAPIGSLGTSGDCAP